ncbi:MAG: UbiA family prenyltransferase [Proteobacteria bacterium]|nr:UbiA family prenyltransferase [Pseudomonadota bacterium]
MNGSMKKMTGNPAWFQETLLPRPRNWPGLIFELTKIHLSLYIALSAVFGHVLAQDQFSMASLKLGAFVLALAAGSAVLNHIQDQKFDLWFARTRNRCLVQKRISPPRAGLISIFLILIGLGGLYVCFPGLGTAGIGLGALVCYNGLYTPLKKRSLGAIFPGTLCGMLPPAMGWASVPQHLSVNDVTGIFMVMCIFGLWQVPHFFMILLKQSQEELEAAPYPSFTRVFPKNQIKGQILIWTSLYGMGILLFLLKGWMHSSGLVWALGFSALGLPLLLATLFGYKRSSHGLSFGFFAINLSMLLFMGLGILDRL